MPDVYRSQQAPTLSIVVEVSVETQAYIATGYLAYKKISRLPLDGAGIAVE